MCHMCHKPGNNSAYVTHYQSKPGNRAYSESKRSNAGQAMLPYHRSARACTQRPGVSTTAWPKQAAALQLQLHDASRAQPHAMCAAARARCNRLTAPSHTHTHEWTDGRTDLTALGGPDPVAAVGGVRAPRVEAGQRHPPEAPTAGSRHVAGCVRGGVWSGVFSGAGRRSLPWHMRHLLACHIPYHARRKFHTMPPRCHTAPGRPH